MSSPARISLGSMPIGSDIPSTLVSGQTLPVRIAFKNTGSEVWSTANGYSLEATGDFGPDSVSLGMNTANPRDTLTLGFILIIPKLAGSARSQVGFMMAKNGVIFGVGYTQNVTVVQPGVILSSTSMPVLIPQMMPQEVEQITAEAVAPSQSLIGADRGSTPVFGSSVIASSTQPTPAVRRLDSSIFLAAALASITIALLAVS